MLKQNKMIFFANLLAGCDRIAQLTSSAKIRLVSLSLQNLLIEFTFSCSCLVLIYIKERKRKEVS